MEAFLLRITFWPPLRGEAYAGLSPCGFKPEFALYSRWAPSGLTENCATDSITHDGPKGTCHLH